LGGSWGRALLEYVRSNSPDSSLTICRSLLSTRRPGASTAIQTSGLASIISNSTSFRGQTMFTTEGLFENCRLCMRTRIQNVWCDCVGLDFTLGLCLQFVWTWLTRPWQSNRRQSNRFSQYHFRGTNNLWVEKTLSLKSKNIFTPNIARHFTD